MTQSNPLRKGIAEIYDMEIAAGHNAKHVNWKNKLIQKYLTGISYNW